VNELFCPVHGIPALIGWILLGSDPVMLHLMFLANYFRMLAIWKKVRNGKT